MPSSLHAHKQESKNKPRVPLSGQNLNKPPLQPVAVRKRIEAFANAQRNAGPDGKMSDVRQEINESLAQLRQQIESTSVNIDHINKMQDQRQLSSKPSRFFVDKSEAQSTIAGNDTISMISGTSAIPVAYDGMQNQKKIRQKDLMSKIEAEKEEIKRQMMENEKVMQARMANLAVEREMLEHKVQSACIKIQSIVRMRIQMKKYKEFKEKSAEDAKKQLYDILN